MNGIERDVPIVVVGLGSPIMCDDAIGLRISEAIESMNLPDVDCYQEAVGGLDILPVIHGYKHALIIDAIQTGQYEPGTILLFKEEDFDSTITDSSTHDVNLPTAIKIGRKMDPTIMPESIRFVAVEVEDIMTVTETMTPRLEAALPSAVDAALHVISEFRN